MEKQVFDWEDYDEVDTAVFNFYDCTLKAQIGKYVVGSIFSSICVNFDEG